MTVKELIELLKNLPESKEVYDCSGFEIIGVRNDDWPKPGIVIMES
jgi:hypothetical protein